MYFFWIHSLVYLVDYIVYPLYYLHMNECNKLLPHLRRIEGQIQALKTQLSGEPDCEKVVQLALSARNSFQSFQSKLLEAYVEQELLTGSVPAAKQHDFATMLKLAK